MLFVNKTSEALNNILYQAFSKISIGDIINEIGFTQLISTLFYGTGLVMAIMAILLGLFFSLFDLGAINSLTNELKEYDKKYNLQITDINQNKIYIIYSNIIDKLYKKHNNIQKEKL